MRCTLAAILVAFLPVLASAQTASSRGDANADMAVNEADVTYLANHLLGTGPAAPRTCLADVNADGAATVADAFRLIDFVVGGGAPPSAQPAEICDGNDNDCDGLADDGFDLLTDSNNCGTCGTVCESNHSVNTCMSGQCSPTCTVGWVNSDGNLNNGCDTLLNTNPSCTSAVSIGSVSGDTFSGTITRSGTGEAWLRATIREDNSVGAVYLSAQMTLTAQSGVDYDLYVYCFTCTSSLAAFSTSGPNSTDVVNLRANDDFGFDDTHDVIIEIRFASAPQSASGSWSLTMAGNAAVATQTCDP